MMIFQLSYMMLDIQKSLVSKHARLYWFDKICSFIFNSCQIRTILQYDLSLMAAIFDFRQSEGCQRSDTVLVEFLSVENMGLDTKIKSLHVPCLPRNILAILWFDLINMLIRSIMQNATFIQVSMRQFPSPYGLYIAFPPKKLMVLNISGFTMETIWLASGLLMSSYVRVYTEMLCEI